MLPFATNYAEQISSRDLELSAVGGALVVEQQLDFYLNICLMRMPAVCIPGTSCAGRPPEAHNSSPRRQHFVKDGRGSLVNSKST